MGLLTTASSVLPALLQPQDELVLALDQAVTGRGPFTSFVVSGPPASGRRMLLREVAAHASRRGQRVFELEILPFGHDTPAQVLLRIASLAPESAEARTLTELTTRWSERLAAARTILGRADAPTVMLVRFPTGALPSGERADRQIQQETLDVIELVTEPRTTCFQVVAAQAWWRSPHKSDARELRLTPSSRSKSFLLGEDWGALAPFAKKLADQLGPDGDMVSPLQLRLGVALLARRTSLTQVLQAIGPGASLRDLETPLRRMLERNEPLAAAIARVARARTAVSESVLRDVAGADAADWDLIGRCFLYPEHDGRRRFHDQLRWLVGDSNPETATHQRLFDYYKGLDGAPEPIAALANVDPWLEKLHHASRADSAGDLDAWLKLGVPSREHFWEYGWSLSYVHRRYREAARVYRELLSRIPGEDDNYAQHYYAYNLDRAGQEPVEAERYFRRAVEGDPTNAWWNARLIGFLTERGRFDAALRAWGAALDTMDPDGERSGGDWLPYHLHKHVVLAGLESGNLPLADTAHRAIREPAASTEIFRWLRSQIDAATQVHRLGEALFPASVSFAEWWQPRLLRPRRRESMTEWRAGRVLSVRGDEVSVAIGHRRGDEPIVEHQVLSREAWVKAASKQPQEADFFEAAQIDGDWIIEVEPPSAAPPGRQRFDASAHAIG